MIQSLEIKTIPVKQVCISLYHILYHDLNNLLHEYLAVIWCTLILYIDTLKVLHMLYTSLNPHFCYAHKQGRMDTFILLKVKDTVFRYHFKICSEKPAWQLEIILLDECLTEHEVLSSR